MLRKGDKGKFLQGGDTRTQVPQTDVHTPITDNRGRQDNGLGSGRKDDNPAIVAVSEFQGKTIVNDDTYLWDYGHEEGGKKIHCFTKRWYNGPYYRYQGAIRLCHRLYLLDDNHMPVDFDEHEGVSGVSPDNLCQTCLRIYLDQIRLSGLISICCGAKFYHLPGVNYNYPVAVCQKCLCTCELKPIE